MPAYKDKKTNTWYAKFYITKSDGTKAQTTKRNFATKREALEYELIARSLDNGKLNDVTFSAFVDKYFEEKTRGKMIKQRTATMKRYLIDTHIIPYFGDKKLTEISTLALENWQTIIKSKGYERTYERMIANQMSALLNHAVTYYKLPENPYKKIKKMGNPQAKEQADYWEREEYDAFIATFEEGSKYHCLFQILFWTGMRLGEALSLRYDRININTGDISIRETYHREKKTDLLTEPKTEKSVRVIKAPAFLIEEIKNYYESLYAYPADERLFPIVERTVEKTMAAHIEKANVQYITVHDLRHSHATYLINLGIPLKDIADRLGHRNIAQIMNTYGHATKQSESNIADTLSKLQ